ncbi:YaaL family protein [Saliterribacillus persicus]|uniref:Uncharacterized protein DUF2508 n=1 Tax=Saliterribacillus persicus TaxID=930114 RepID=A0A368X9G7_9BACI|nr:YaaL family protein [Saliterribacillus persicus]RCW64601.1 uncharacterized protein DUF2508 [Saliterribacillus persicus]
MFDSKKIKKDMLDQEILDTIFSLKKEWHELQFIMDRSVEPTEEGLHELAVVKAKYFFLLREARNRNLSAMRK